LKKIITDSALSDKFKEFLNQFKDEKGFKYVEMIANCIKTNKTIQINEKDFTKEVNDLFEGQTIITIQKAIYRAVKEIFANDEGVSRTGIAVKEDRIKIKYKKIVFGNPNPKNKESEKEIKDERHDSKKLFDFADSRICKTVISTYDRNKVFSLVELYNHFETLDLDSTRAIQWLSHEYHKVDSNVIHNQDFFKNTLHALVSQAQMNGTINEAVHTRIAQNEHEIYYDLGSTDYEAVKITKKGISLVKINNDTPMFVRPSSLYEQAKPKYDNKNAIEDLTDLLLILDEDKIIFKPNLIGMFLESVAVPMPVATGSADSSKSTFTALLKRVVDPSGKSKENNLIGFPKKKDDLIAIESHRYLIAFDNVSEIDQEMSDELCRSITGGGSSARKYYTNSDESISSYKNKIILNGIVPRLDYPDLQTRIITYQRKPLDHTNRLTDLELEDKFNKLLPQVLGCIFKILQKSLKVYPTVKKQVKPIQRLADFEIWGETIAQCLGYEPRAFLKAYDRKIKEDAINTKESHVIVDLIVSIMEGKEVYENQAKILFNEIKARAEDEGIDVKSKYVYFPKLPSYLTRELTKVNPILKQLGFIVDTFHYTKNDGKYIKNSMIVRISRKEEQKTLE